MSLEEDDTPVVNNNHVNDNEYNGSVYIIDAKEYYETGKKTLAIPWLKEAYRKSGKYKIGSIDERLFFTVIKHDSSLGHKEFWNNPEQYSKFWNTKLNNDSVNKWYEDQEKIRNGEKLRVNSIDGFQYKKINLENNKLKEFKETV
jgi:hypothetical protein